MRNVAKYRTNNVNHFLSINSSKVRKKLYFRAKKVKLNCIFLARKFNKFNRISRQKWVWFFGGSRKKIRNWNALFYNDLEKRFLEIDFLKGDDAITDVEYALNCRCISMWCQSSVLAMNSWAVIDTLKIGGKPESWSKSLAIWQNHPIVNIKDPGIRKRKFGGSKRKIGPWCAGCMGIWNQPRCIDKCEVALVISRGK